MAWSSTFSVSVDMITWRAIEWIYMFSCLQTVRVGLGAGHVMTVTSVRMFEWYSIPTTGMVHY